MFEPLIPLSIIHLPIIPRIHPLAMGFPSLKLPIVRIPIRVAFKSSAISEIIFPKTLILSAHRVAHHTQSVSFAFLQLTDKNSVWIFPLYVTWQGFQRI
jgi:hypothetical protein